MFTIVIGARVVRRPTPRCRALSKMLFRRGLRVFCGTGGLVVSLLKVGLRLAVESIVWLFGVVLIVVSFSSLSFSIVFDGGKVVNLFLGRKKGLLLIPTFPVLPTGLRLGNKSDNFDFGLNLLLDLPDLPDLLHWVVVKDSAAPLRWLPVLSLTHTRSVHLGVHQFCQN